MKQSIYHIGFIKGTGKRKCWSNNHKADTLIVQARRDLDYLSPDLWQYRGRHVTTKAQLKARKAEILATVNKQEGTAFTHVIID